MRFKSTYIPYGAYWSTPFCKWQGSLSTLNAVHVAAQAARKAFAERDLSPEVFDAIVLGCLRPGLAHPSAVRSLSRWTDRSIDHTGSGYGWARRRNASCRRSGSCPA